MQNNYAWSMTELGDYVYVSTARNIFYSIVSNQVFGDIPIPDELTPRNPVMRGEICVAENTAHKSGREFTVPLRIWLI